LGEHLVKKNKNSNRKGGPPGFSNQLCRVEGSGRLQSGKGLKKRLGPSEDGNLAHISAGHLEGWEKQKSAWGVKRGKRKKMIDNLEKKKRGQRIFNLTRLQKQGHGDPARMAKLERRGGPIGRAVVHRVNSRVLVGGNSRNPHPAVFGKGKVGCFRPPQKPGADTAMWPKKTPPFRKELKKEKKNKTETYQKNLWGKRKAKLARPA